MKLYKLLFLLLFFLLFASCTTWRGALVSNGNLDDAINNTIADFLHTTKQKKTDTVFEITIKSIDEKIEMIIGRAENKIYPRKENKVGTYDKIFPTRYTIKNGLLFYWRDTTQVITQDIISVFEEYNHIVFNWQDEYDLPPWVINDGYEGFVYYLCKNNLKNYKKKKTDVLGRRYRVPKLRCNCKLDFPTKTEH
jgi:hypothetical protein